MVADIPEVVDRLRRVLHERGLAVSKVRPTPDNRGITPEQALAQGLVGAVVPEVLPAGCGCYLSPAECAEVLDALDSGDSPLRSRLTWAISYGNEVGRLQARVTELEKVIDAVRNAKGEH